MSYTREEFDRIKAAAEKRGFTVVSRWRPGLENIRLGDIVLSESCEETGQEPAAAAARKERAMPYQVEVLRNEDGPVMLARGETVAEALALAADEAARQGVVVTDTEADIHLGWVRATPCNPEGHEIRDGFEWCDGGRRCHYAHGKSGPGAFRAAFVSVRYLSPGERPAATEVEEERR